MQNLRVNRVAPGTLLAKIFFLAAAALLFIVILVGCGGSGASSSAPWPTFVDGSVSDTDREAAFTALESLFQNVHGQKDAASQIVAKMKTMKQFARVEVSKSGDAVGWFTDGQMCACLTSDPDEGAQPSAARPTIANQARPADLPAAPTAYLMNAFEPARPDATGAIAGPLTAHGYNVVMLSGLVNDYKQITNAGLLFIHAHGVISQDKNNFERFWYSTSESPTVQKNKVDYQAYWNKGTIATGIADEVQADGSVKTVRKYCVSDQFLHDSGMSFAKNAIWLSQACSSYNPYILKAALDPTSGFPGVAVYGGWTLPELSAESTATTSFMFDRLLGLNQVAPVDPDNPPPTDFTKLTSLLADNTRPVGGLPYDVSVTKDGQSMYRLSTGADTNVPTIIPVITGTDVDATAETLTLSGMFGAPEGSVTIGGTPLAVHTWRETSIVVDKPSDPSGKLVVRSLGGSSSSGYLLSNPYDYTALTLSISPPGGSMDQTEKKTFSVSATTGTIPDGATYRWSLTGKGKLSGGNPVVTSTNSITYTAPSANSTDVLKVEVLNSSKSVAGSATTTIAVGDLRFGYTVSGDVSGENIPPLSDGTFSEPFYLSLHVAASGSDGALAEFVNTDTSLTFQLVATLSSGGRFSTGQTFSYGSNKVGTFHFLPGKDHSNYIFLATSGSMQITKVKDNGDGTFTIGFSATATDFKGCTIAGGGSFSFHYTYDTVN